jgi:hypothetical protein
MDRNPGVGVRVSGAEVVEGVVATSFIEASILRPETIAPRDESGLAT